MVSISNIYIYIYIPLTNIDQIIYYILNVDGEVIFKITPSGDHPVDLYFVMDLSNSMKTYQDNLVEASLAIAEKIRVTTKKFRMGFGSFSDKPTAPFAGT